jgi:tetratricopeptide (TPR) repeat protein
MDVTSAN